MSRLLRTFVAVFLLLPVGRSLAQTGVTYSGPDNGAWHDLMHWSPNIIPDNDTNPVTPIFYTASTDKAVEIDGYQFDIAGLTTTDQITTRTSWDFVAGLTTGAPQLFNSGTFLIAPPMGGGAIVGVPHGQTLTISGNGLIRLAGPGQARIRGNGTLVNQDNTIRGVGTFGEGVLTIINNGIIAATDSAGAVGTLLVHPGPEGLTNLNVLEARSPGNLVLSGTILNTGTIHAHAGGLVHFDVDAHVFGGTISNEGLGTIRVAQTTRWTGPIDHSSANTRVDADLIVLGQINNTGSIGLNGQLRVDVSANFSGSGIIRLSNGTIDTISANPNFESNNFIYGGGVIGSPSMTISSEGGFIADSSTRALTLVASEFDNLGLLQANGGILNLLGPVYRNEKGLIHATNSSQVRLVGPRISGGELRTTSGGTIAVQSLAITELVLLNVNGRVVCEPGSELWLNGEINGTGVIECLGARLRVRSGAELRVATKMFNGSTLIAVPPAWTRDVPEADPVFTNSGTITGAGSIGSNSLSIVNNGLIGGDGGGPGLTGTLFIDPSADGLTNNGTIEATDLGQVILTGNGSGMFNQSGTGVIRAASPGSHVQLFNSVHVNGGQLGAGAGSISVAFGTITLENLTSNANLVQTGVTTLSIGSGVTLNGAITTPSVGTLLISGALGGGNGVMTNNGRLIVAGGGSLDAGSVEGTGSIVAQSASEVRVDTMRQVALTIENGSTAVLKSSPVRSRLGPVTGSLVNTLNIGSNGAALDLTNRGMAVNYSGGSPLGTIAAQIASGYAGGTWNGPGIRSSAAAADPAFGVGYAEATQVGSPTTFLERPIDSSSVLFRFTYVGDADLDGDVDIGDLGRLASNWQSSNVWSGGDFDYNSTVNVNDLGLLASNWQAGVGNPLGPSLSDALAGLGLPTTSVPEPTALAAIGLSMLGMGARRFRRSI